MKPLAIVLVVVLGLAVAAGRPSPSPGPEPVDRAVANATRWLYGRQSADGAWRSETYGLMASGQSMTPFVLWALLSAPDRGEAAIGRALASMRAAVGRDGALGVADPSIVDYPSYASALGLRALLHEGDAESAERLVRWLRGQQIADPLGWSPEFPGYGAWGTGGAPRRPPGAGHVNLSMTRYVLQALSHAGVEADSAVLRRAAKYLERSQGPDGSFVFSLTQVEANKAGGASIGYGTATADGVLALLATGASVDDPRVRRGVAWLVSHHRLDAVPGLEQAPGEGWRTAMRYYYAAASAEVFSRCGVEQAPAGRDWRRDLRVALVSEQRPDGSWRNENFLMKEDDPLVATTLALSALLSAR